MQAYLQLLSSEKIKLSNLIEAVYPIEKADEAYSNIKTQNPKPLMVLLQYDVESSKKAIHFMRVNKTVPELGARPSLAVIGSGGFAKAVHLPNLLAMRGNIRLAAIVSKSGHNAKSTASQFGADYATTDYQRVLNDNTINSVMITTRHDSHASLVLEALQAGKNVFVEKPLALSRGEVELIQSYYSQGERYNLLMVGYNRRFSKYAKAIKKHLLSRINPMIINYRMNVGYIPSDHWLQGKEGGGRNLGEACHIYDLFNYFTDAQVVSVEAKSISPSTSYYFKNDNFTTVIEYADGSICNLIYTALGDTSYPKEIMEVYFDGKIFIMEDYCALKSFGIEKTEIQSNFPEKGHIEEINSFFDAINNGKEWPIPFWQIIQASEIAFQVEEKIQEKRGKLVKKIENLKEEDKTICISELEILV
jgi:predicted dehydrogenase